MCVGSNPTPDIVLSNIKLVTSKVYAKYTTPAGIRTPDLWIRNPMRYPLRYKGCVSLCESIGTSRYELREMVPSPLNRRKYVTRLHVPVAQSVSARYLYCSTCEKCRGCEFEPHLEQWFWSKQFYFINRCYPSPTNYCANDPAPLTPIRFK